MNKFDQYFEKMRKFKFTDTRVGTDSKFEMSNGNTLPLTGVPFAMNYFAVQTNRDRGSWWFDPKEDRFEGFRLTHQPSPWMGDFQYLTILPTSNFDRDYVTYDSKNSIFYPHYNEIRYQANEQARLTGSKYSGIINFQSDGKAGYIIYSKNLKLERKGDLILGYVCNFSDCHDKNFRMYIVISLDSDFSFEKKDGYYTVKTDHSQSQLAISTSFISQDQAIFNHKNMARGFEDMLVESQNTWLDYLDRFEVELKIYDKEDEYARFTPYDAFEQERFFYHAVYRCFLFPMSLYEKSPEGENIHKDIYSGQVKKGRLYTNMGLWDLNKSLFPLFSLVAQDDYEKILEGVLNSYREAGYLPKWLSPDERGLMPGTLIDNVIADASSKNIGGDYMEEFLEAMIKSSQVQAQDSKFGRAAVREYKEHGYVPARFNESVNQTLDNSLSDFSIAIVARNLGKEDLANKYFELSKNYRNLFDPESGFLRAKDESGDFVDKNFNPLRWGNPYTEGSAYQNSFNVYHDIEGLKKLYQEEDGFKKKLMEIANSKTEFLEGSYKMVIHEMREYERAHFGHIAISNQPSFHLPYLYTYIGRPDFTQLIMKELMLNYFNYSLKGYPGDEDNGSMSAWYILSSLGFYPVCPGVNEYIIGMPFWDRARIKLSNGNTLEINVDENYHHKKFISSLKVDGKDHRLMYFKHDQLLKAKRIDYRLGILYDDFFDTKKMPYSLSKSLN